MEKSKIFVWALSLLFSFSLFGEEVIPYSKGYVRFADLKKVFPELTLTIDSTILKIELKHKSSPEFKFLLDSKFFSFKNMIEPLSKPAIYIKKDLFLPREIVEGIFIFLIDREVSYTFSEKNLHIVLESKILQAEEIPVKYIIIDAGHGGKDPGAVAVNGEYEKTFTLKIAKLLKKILKEKFPKTKIKYTRKRDEFVSLEDRALIANKKFIKSKDTIFISLHCNSTPNPENSPTGFEVYYLAQSLDIEQKRETEIINSRLIDSKRDTKIRSIQTGMMSSGIQRKSITLAKSIEGKLKESLNTMMLSRGVKRSNFHVLRGSIMPAVLIELGFVTNANDVKLLEEKTIQLKLAKGIAEGIKAYAIAKN